MSMNNVKSNKSDRGDNNKQAEEGIEHEGEDSHKEFGNERHDVN